MFLLHIKVKFKNDIEVIYLAKLEKYWKAKEEIFKNPPSHFSELTTVLIHIFHMPVHICVSVTVYPISLIITLYYYRVVIFNLSLEHGLHIVHRFCETI